jgi:hypothetical protein
MGATVSSSKHLGSLRSGQEREALSDLFPQSPTYTVHAHKSGLVCPGAIIEVRPESGRLENYIGVVVSDVFDKSVSETVPWKKLKQSEQDDLPLVALASTTITREVTKQFVRVRWFYRREELPKGLADAVGGGTGDIYLGIGWYDDIQLQSIQKVVSANLHLLYRNGIDDWSVRGLVDYDKAKFYPIPCSKNVASAWIRWWKIRLPKSNTDRYIRSRLQAAVEDRFTSRSYKTGPVDMKPVKLAIPFEMLGHLPVSALAEVGNDSDDIYALIKSDQQLEELCGRRVLEFELL